MEFAEWDESVRSGTGTRGYVWTYRHYPYCPLLYIQHTGHATVSENTYMFELLLLSLSCTIPLSEEV